MINNKIIPIEECPMCGDENVPLIDICPINNPDHKICAECIVNLIEKYDTKCDTYLKLEVLKKIIYLFYLLYFNFIFQFS